MDPLKNELVNSIERHLEKLAKDDDNFPGCEVQRVSPLVVQVKVWDGSGPPRYLNVRVSEMM